MCCILISSSSPSCHLALFGFVSVQFGSLIISPTYELEYLYYYTFKKPYEVVYNFHIHKFFRKNHLVAIIVIDQNLF
jgi:hypothetical protein